MTLLLCPCLGLLFSFVFFNAGADMLEETMGVFIGECVTLPCLNLVKQTNCSKVTWLSNKSPVTELVTLGRRRSETENRVTLTSNCSLHISEIRAGDEECYTCRQFSGVDEDQIGKDARICLFFNKGTTTGNNGATSMDNNDLSGSSHDRKKLFMIIPSVLVIGALSVTALIAWLRYHRRAQMSTSVGKPNMLEVKTQSTEHGHKSGEDLVNYAELNYNVVKPRKVDIDKVYQTTEYAVIKIS